jgi:hypothetical protein
LSVESNREGHDADSVLQVAKGHEMKVTARIQDLEEMESDWVAGELRSDLEKTKMESWMVGGEGEEELTDGLSYLEPEGD